MAKAPTASQTEEAEALAAPELLAAITTITAATWATGQATFTTAAPHGLTTGSLVTISGVNPAGYNGTFTAAAGTTGSTIVVPMATNPGTYVSGGSASPGNPKTVMTTNGVSVDHNGDVWYYGGTKGLIWLANTANPPVI